LVRHLAKDAEKLAVELITRAVETTGNPNPDTSYTELLKNPPPNIGIRVTLRDHQGDPQSRSCWS